MKLANYSPPKILRNTLSEWPKNSPTDAASRFSAPEAEKRTQVSKLYTDPFPFAGDLDRVVITLTD